MKTFSKPISSPGRSEKFPPPLMRFLRTNVSSRSTRGRSRASPMFYLRTKKSVQLVIQEPSSPKVTCIGQVRVRRSSKSNVIKNTSSAVKSRRSSWWKLKKPIFWGKFCGGFHNKNRKRPPFPSVFRKWGVFYRFWYCKKKVEVTEEDYFGGGYSNENKMSEFISTRSSNVSQYESSIQENKKENLINTCSSSSSSPPKNALLLTRCRSAPYRSSSLGGRFCDSPLKAEDGYSEKTEDVDSLEKANCGNVIEMGRISTEESSNTEMGKSDDLKVISGISVQPLFLTRCKSEPGRRGERLIEEPTS